MIAAHANGVVAAGAIAGLELPSIALAGRGARAGAGGGEAMDGTPREHVGGATAV